MELKLIWKHARAAVLECCEGSIYEMAQPCQIYLNGEFYKETKQVVNVLYDLEPEKEYCVAVQKGEEKSEIVFCTEAQDYTLNVRDSRGSIPDHKSVFKRSSYNGTGKRGSPFGMHRA